MRTSTYCLIALLAACGPKPDAGSPADEPTGGGKGSGTSAAAPQTGDVTLEFMGVSYTVHAEPTQDIDDFGLLVRITAEITDGKEHAYVADTVETAEGKTSIRFDVQVASDDYEEDRYSGKLDLITHAPGEPLVLERRFPGPKDQPLRRGETLELVAGIWGTEDASGGQRYSPDLARISLTIPDAGLAEPLLEPMDPNQELPKDFISWEIWAHKLVVKPYYPLKQLTKTGGGEMVAVYEVGDTVVRVKEHGVVVNDMFYGKLGKSEAILVDHGKVSVGTEDRTGEEMPQEDLLEYYPNPFSEHDMGPHKVTKSPGATKFGIASAGKDYRLVLDGLVIMIEKGFLYVDDVCYGKVPGKAKIHIYFDEVKVGKQVRKPSDKCKK
jgi:hypothetical protein